MATFDRFDICEAHYILESDYNVGGILRERPSNIRRNMSSGYQLSRMGFNPSPNLSFETLSENGQELYNELVQRYSLPVCEENFTNPIQDESTATVSASGNMGLIIYDNGGDTLDRYTVFPYTNSQTVGERLIYLGMAEGGVGFSQWGELPSSSQHGPHLGKLVKFDDLSEQTRRHIAARLAE